MENKPLFISDLPVERTLVDDAQIGQFESEDDFMDLSIELLKEAGQLTAILSCIYPIGDDNRPRKWNRDEAVLGGLMVRLTKMQRGFLDAVCQNRLEMAHIIFRCLVETVINLKYLIQEDSDDLFDKYVEYSLREEKRLLNRLNEEVARRGYELPIESRMQSSIMSAFDKSGLTPADVDETSRRSWGYSIYNRARAVGMAQAYIAIYGLPNHVIHGNWQDLLQYHVEYDDDGFSPSHEWTPPRPQIVFVAALMSSNVCQHYLSSILPECEDQSRLLEHVQDCTSRILRADALHEQFIQDSRSRSEEQAA